MTTYILLFSFSRLWTFFEVKSLSHVRLFATPWTVAHQAPPSMGFSRQEYWSGLPFPFSRRSSWSRDWTWVSCTAGRFPITWATGEAPTVEEPRRNHLEIKFFRSCHSWYHLFSVISPLWLSSTESWEDVSVLPVKFIKSCICCFWFW